jgi:adenylyltransferase/sulfurtransferase
MPHHPLPRGQAQRYARHLTLSDIGVRGQHRLGQARVLIVGLGALGSPVATYLAAAGVGTLGLVDHDQVRLANLQQQILHRTDSVGTSKTDSAARTLASLNPEVRLEVHARSLDRSNATTLIGGYDVIVDGTDNFGSRYLLSDAAFFLKKPLVHGSIFRIEGQVTVFLPGRGCYRCLYPEPPPPGLVGDAEDVGVLATLPGVIGTIEATETIKLITGRGEPLVNRVLLHDALAMTFREIRFRRNPSCPVCGDHPRITQLQDYDAFVGAVAG